MKRMTLPLLLALALLVPDAVFGQPPQSRGRMKERRRDQIEERIHTMKIWKLTEELQLSDEQASRFFPLMNEFESEQDEIETGRRETLDRLGEIVWDSNPDPQAIAQLLDELETSGEQQMTLRKKFRKDVSGILKPEQMGKLALFNARFPEMLRGMVRDLERERGPEAPPPDRQRDW